MDKAVSDHIEERLRSIFPEGVIERVDVLGYGDDPAVEPGETAVRVFINRGDQPEGEESNEQTLHAFEDTHRAAMKKLHDKLPRFIGWVEFRPESTDGTAKPRGPVIRIGGRGGRAATLDEVSEGLTPVMTRLGPADLATVDTLITAGIASSRAEVMRWALGRIREHPAYAQLQERVHEINDLKAQF